MKVRILSLAKILILAGALASGAAMADELYTFPFSKEVSAGGQPIFDISNTSGSIVITSHNQPVIKIEALKKVKAKGNKEAEKIASHISIGVSVSGNKVTVETDYEDVRDQNFWEFLFGRKAGRSAWVEYQVWVPEKCRLLVSATSADIEIAKIKENIQISATSGDIEVRDISGDTEIDVTSGDLTLADLKGKTSISATSGDLKARNLEGSLLYQSSSGDLRAEEIKGEVQIETSSGDIRLIKVAGDINIESSSADILVDQLEGALSIHTTSGEIVASTQKLSGQLYSLESSSGDIRFTLPDQQGGRLELETSSGTLRAEIPVTVESISDRRFSGYINKTGPEIIIRTTSGDVLLSGK
jgi:DUF4097 and DUF4098 domain-containing protein YvlB